MEIKSTKNCSGSQSVAVPKIMRTRQRIVKSANLTV
jgi:hypothetical protein